MMVRPDKKKLIHGGKNSELWVPLRSDGEDELERDTRNFLGDRNVEYLDRG